MAQSSQRLVIFTLLFEERPHLFLLALTTNFPTPNRLQAAASFGCLLKLSISTVYAPYRHVMEKVVKDIGHCLYSNYEKLEEQIIKVQKKNTDCTALVTLYEHGQLHFQVFFQVLKVFKN